MKNRVVVFGGQILLIFAIILSVYYIFFLQPQISRTAIETEVKKLILQEKYAILQRRLSFVQMAKLNPTSSRYIFAKSRIYQDLDESAKKIEELKNTSLPELKSFFPGSNDEYEKLKIQHQSLQDEIQDLVVSDNKIIDEQKQFDQQVDKLFEYFPSNDFSDINEEYDCQIIEKKAQTAQFGIKEIEKNIADPALSTDFQQTYHHLQEIEKNCSINLQLAEISLQKLIESIAKNKKDVFAKKIDLILNNEEYLETIAKETQLIFQFDDLYNQAENLLTQ